MAARLKVFFTSDGLTDYVVAASSRLKALVAWGVHQDLFKQGAAHETDDPALTEAALSRPGEVLRRPSGGRAQLANMKPVARPKPKAPSKAALRKVADLEARLGAVDADYEKALARIEASRRRLEEEARRARELRDGTRRKLEARLEDARRALEE